jgi:hypothetical protein
MAGCNLRFGPLEHLAYLKLVEARQVFFDLFVACNRNDHGCRAAALSDDDRLGGLLEAAHDLPGLTL